MCGHCNYRKILESVEIEPSVNRLLILEVIGDNKYPLSAGDIYRTVHRNHPINKVTVYRILELFLQKKIVERLSTGGRAACFGMAPSEYHVRHPHFYCTVCEQMDCLNPESIDVEMGKFNKTFPGKVDRVEIRIDGVCRKCLKSHESGKKE